MLADKHPDESPLHIWQVGYGTQSSMNEVVENRASEVFGYVCGPEPKVHPGDVVNKSQSSNDVFPTAMHVSTLLALCKQLLLHLKDLTQTLNEKSFAFADIIKIGRTHLQDSMLLFLARKSPIGWLRWSTIISKSKAGRRILQN